jgi:hypothetical protein
VTITKERVSYLNSVLLTVVVALLSWTVLGVQQLKEQNAANSVMFASFKEESSKFSVELKALSARVGLLEIEVAKTKQRLGIN